eukprot:4697217-Pleurochrysis_carterae.AAC.1
MYVRARGEQIVGSIYHGDKLHCLCCAGRAQIEPAASSLAWSIDSFRGILSVCAVRGRCAQAGRYNYIVRVSTVGVLLPVRPPEIETGLPLPT